MQEGILAKHFTNEGAFNVKCNLCPHHCRIKPGKQGLCRVRQNVKGSLYASNYGLVSSMSLDPIEKKPLYRFHPGSQILSVGTLGCNFKCSFCQNWRIAHEDPKTIYIEPEQLIRKAKECVGEGNIGIAYTYNEPSIWYEFIEDTAKLAKKAGLFNVLVTNGFLCKEPLEELLPYVDAMNIDVKAFNDKFYKEICQGSLKDVKATVEASVGKCHVEVTTLIVPGLNDSLEEIEELVQWLSSLSPEIPLHLSRYFPNYHLKDPPPTPVEILVRFRDKALEYLKYVYLGNI